MPDKKIFVLESEKYGVHRTHFDGYYTGDTYQFQGEMYAVCDTDFDKVKKYSFLKRAENAKEALNRKITNYYFRVREICPIAQENIK